MSLATLWSMHNSATSPLQKKYTQRRFKRCTTRGKLPMGYTRAHQHINSLTLACHTYKVTNQMANSTAIYLHSSTIQVPTATTTGQRTWVNNNSPACINVATLTLSNINSLNSPFSTGIRSPMVLTTSLKQATIRVPSRPIPTVITTSTSQRSRDSPQAVTQLPRVRIVNPAKMGTTSQRVQGLRVAVFNHFLKSSSRVHY